VKDRLIVESAGALLAGSAILGAMWKWRMRTIAALRYAYAGVGHQAFTLLETFFNEAAVLWFVFPVLDALYPKDQGTHMRMANVLLTSWVGAFAFFCLAVFFKKLADMSKPKDD
jgi:hypothetical protein